MGECRVPPGYREVRISGFHGLARELWPSSIPLQDLVVKIGRTDGLVLKMRADRAIKIRGDLHLKEEFFRPGRSGPLLVKSLWGRSRLRRQWRSSLAARERGIPTPEPLAYLERRQSLFLFRSLLVTRLESGFTTLSQYLRSRKEEGGIRQMGPFLEGLGAAVQRLHQQGMVHSDLKGSNVLVKEEDGAWEFRFTDLKAARFSQRSHPFLPWRKREGDVLRLLASLRAFFGPSERTLFLRSYLSVDAEAAQPTIRRWERESQRRFPSSGAGVDERG